MPATTVKFQLNDGELDALATQGVPPTTISVLKRFRATGGALRTREDLELLGLGNADIKSLLKVASFALPLAPAAQKLAVLKFQPPGLVGHQVLFAVHKSQEGVVVAQGQVPIAADGTARLKYPAVAKSGVFKLSVRRADGSAVEVERAATAGFRFELSENELTKASFNVTTSASTPAVVARTELHPPMTIRGRVLAADPASVTRGLTVVILAAIKPNPAKDDFFPICDGVTEDRGYFVTGTPNFFTGDYANLTAAQAQVGDARIEVRLDFDVATKKSTLPQRVILFLTGTSAGKLGAEPDGCGCSALDFTKRRVLDEFSYHFVVRTSDPKIEALTITDIPDLDLEDLLPSADPLRRKLVGLKLPAATVASFLDNVAALDAAAADRLAALARAAIARAVAAPKSKTPRGRLLLEEGGSLDWDETPTIYQATSVAHGHLLQFKQEWTAAGYSMGDLLYSLPLAPGQKKQIVVFDWDRKESAANTQQLDYQENLYGSLARDRDVNEVATATLSEHLEGDSSSSTGGFGVGGGVGAAIPIPAGPVIIPVGALVGAGGGSSGSSSRASQDASRDTSATTLQHLNDRTIQSANSVRSQRSTVVQTVAQGERFQVSAEVVANYNHCHALTMQYFEVIRHFEVQTRLASVQECLFVPLKIGPFSRKKALRWRSLLARCVPTPRLVAGFAAMERVDEELASGTQNYYDRIGMPRVRFAEEELESLEGELTLEIEISRPLDADDGKKVVAGWTALNSLLGADFFDTHLAGTKARDEAFLKHAGPRIAQALVDRIVVLAGLKGGASRKLPLDATLMTDFRPGQKMRVSLRPNAVLRQLKRQDVEFIELAVGGTGTLEKRLLELVRAVVHTASMRYRTAHLDEHLFESLHVDDELTIAGGRVLIQTPLSAQAMRNPREEDAELHDALLHHLNENLERYHQHIWTRMDPQRRFMLLDGIAIAERGDTRSVASVVENRLIGIVGNCLVLPVAHGFRLDPLLADDLDLFAHYYTDPPEPVRLSLPTKGVYAEAVMGQCNSCERKEEDRFWRWEESPIPDSPTTINPVNLPAPTVTQPNLQPQPLTAPIINLQNAPAAPDVQGFAALVQLLGNGNAFRDVTGLSENQRNALAALQRAFQTTELFGTKAAELTNLAAALTPAGQQLDQIKQARANNLLDEKGARDRTESALDASDGRSPAATLRQMKQLGELAQSGALDPSQAQAAIARLADGIGRNEDKLTDALVKVASENAGNFEVTANREGGVVSAKFSEGSAGGAKGPSPSSDAVSSILSLARKTALELVDAIRTVRDGAGGADPNTLLAKACREALVKLVEKEAKKDATAIVKGLPLGGALIVSVKLSLAFADGVGEEFLVQRGAMEAEFANDVAKARISEDGLSEEAYAALEELRRWQARNVEKLRPIFLNGLRRMIGKAVELGLNEIKNIFDDALGRLLADVVANNDLLALVASELQKGSEVAGAAGRRRRAFDATLKFMIETFVKQLADSRMTTALETTLKAAGGKNPVVVDLLAGAIRAVLDVEVQELRNELGEAFPDVKARLVEMARAVKLQFDAAGSLALTPVATNVIAAQPTGVSAPQAVVTLVSTVLPTVPTGRMIDAADIFFVVKQAAAARIAFNAARCQKRVDEASASTEQAQRDNEKFTIGEMKTVSAAYTLLDETVINEATRVGDLVLPADTARREAFIGGQLFVSDLVRVQIILGPGREALDQQKSARVVVKNNGF